VRASLIVNPEAGSDRARSLVPLLTERLRTFARDLDVIVTNSEDDTVRAAARAVDERHDVIFVAGGDGTLNGAVRAVAAIDGGLRQVAFGVIPAGTGNDFAKVLDLGEVAENAVERLLDARVIDVDLGTLNGLTFVNVSAGGFVADVSAVLTDELKDVTGKLAYIIGGARALLGREPFTARLTSPDYPDAIDLQMFAACNARFIGGGHPIAPDALIDDGLLDVFLVKRTPTIEFVAVLQKIAAGAHGGDDRILQFRAAELDLEFDRTVNVNVDGELLSADRCRYRVLHRAARFLCGPAPHATAAPRPLTV
jgi:diacylglycerol kinase (ATP)